MARVPPARPLSRWQRLRQTFRSPITWFGLFGVTLFEASNIPNFFLTGVPPRDLFVWTIVRAALMSGAMLIGMLVLLRVVWLAATVSLPVFLLLSLTCGCFWIALSMLALSSIQLLVFPAQIDWISTVQNVGLIAGFALGFVVMMAVAVDIAREMNRSE